MAALTALAEDYFESGNAPHEALGRAARKLMQGGALYLGGGVGLEKQSTKTGDRYNLTSTSGTGKAETFTGPLSAVMRGFALAGGSTASDTPGGETKVTDPAAAARLRELVDEERRTRQDIARYEARLAAKVPSSPFGVPPAGLANDDAWEARRLAELKRELAQLAAERAMLLTTGKVEEAAEVGKPGTNWKQVTPGHRKKIGPIVRHYMKDPHPFAACVRDNTKRFGEERAKRVCAVVKDMGERSTKWRKGGSKKLAEAEEDFRIVQAIEAAAGRVAAIDATLGAGAAVELAERAGGLDDPQLDALGEAAFGDLGTLFVGGHPLGVLWQQVREGFAEALHPRDFLGQFKRKLSGLKVGEKATVPGGVTVERHDGGFKITGGAGLGHHKVGSEFRTGKPAADENLTSPGSAATLAVTRSLRSRDPKSLGGDKHYQGLGDYEGEHGKPGAPKGSAPATAGHVEKIRGVLPNANVRHTDRGLEVGGFSGSPADARRKLKDAGLDSEDVFGQLVVKIPAAAKAGDTHTQGAAVNISPGSRGGEVLRGTVVDDRGGEMVKVRDHHGRTRRVHRSRLKPR